MTLNKKLVILFIGFTLVPLLLFGAAAFTQAYKVLKDARIAQLNNIADLKKDKIETFFSERKADIFSAAHSFAIRRSLPALGRHRGHRQGASFEQAKQDLDNSVKTLLDAYGYLDVMLTDPEGTVVYESNLPGPFSHVGKPLPDWRSFDEGEKGIYFSDVFQHEGSKNRFEMFGAGPVKDLSGKFTGLIVVEIDMDPIYKFIQDATGLGKSGEALIAKREGDAALFYSPLRRLPGAALKKKVFFKDEAGLPAIQAVQGNSGSGVVRDYADHEVLAAWRYIPSLRWGVVTKIDTDEAFGPITQLRNITVVFGVLLVLFAAFAALSTSKTVTGPVLSLQKGAEAIAAGDLTYRVGTGEQDEIGRLSRAFDAMTDTLVRDIGERVRIEKELRESAEAASSILNATSESVFLTDRDGVILHLNETAARRLGYTVEELQNKVIFNAMPPELAQKKHEWFQKVIQTKKPVFFEDEREGRYIENGLYPIFDSRDDVARVTIFGRDITERRMAEEKILMLNQELRRHVRELEASNRELEAFSYSVSHDLRSPLRSIDGFSLALLEDYAGSLDDRGKDYLERVRAGSQRMAQLIDGLLNLSRVTRSALRRGPVNLSKLAGESAERLKKAEPGRTVNITIADGAVAEGDEPLLRIVVDNLIENAWKFTGGRECGIIEFGVDRQGEKPVYFIKDNGAGFDMAYAKKLFGPFQRLHAMNEFPGTGIGLATVQRIIDRHGGRVWIEAEVAKGTSVYFTLG